MLFEPTNIIPSILTNTGTIAVADGVSIEWQVNGNSTLTRFQIDVFENTTDSKFVHSTGIVTSNPTPYAIPFYGKDRLGEYIPFLYAPMSGVQNVTWSDWGLTDGNNYKYKITQWYAANNSVVQKTLSQNLTAGNAYYFTYSQGGATYYLYFSVSDDSIFTNGNIINYSIPNQNAWVLDYSNQPNPRVIEISMGRSDDAPGEEYTQLGGAAAAVVSTGEAFTTQSSASAIITRTAPTLAVTITDQSGSTISNNTVTNSSVYAHGNYAQAQSDNISWVRWQLAVANASGTVDTTQILDDTGEVYTPLLEYSYNGLFNGESASSPAKYALNCTLQTESGVEISSGWIVFDVYYQSNQYTGDFTAQMLCDDDCNYLSWDALESIPGTASPADGVTVTGGRALIQSGANVSWSTIGGVGGDQEQISFAPPWSAAWKGDIIGQLGGQFSGTVYRPKYTATAAGALNINDGVGLGGIYTSDYSPDGSLLVVGGLFPGYAAVFSVNGTNSTFLTYLTNASGGALTARVHVARFNHAGTKLFIGIAGQSGILYDVSGTTIDNPQLVRRSGGASDSFLTAAFSPDDDVLVVGGTGAYAGQIYNTSSSSITYSGFLSGASSPLTSSNPIYSLAFSPDGERLYVGGNMDGNSTSGGLSVYDVNGTTITYSAAISRNGGFGEEGVSNIAISPDGKYLVVSGPYSGTDIDPYLSLYKISGTNVSYFGEFTLNGAAIPSDVTTMGFSADGSRFAVGFSYLPNAAKGAIYLLYPATQEIRYLSDIPLEEAAGWFVTSLAFSSSDSDIMFLGINSTIQTTYDNFIKLTEENDLKNVSCMAFNANKTLLVVGGTFSGYAALFSVSGDTATYIGNVVKNEFLPLDGNVNCAAFNSNGAYLVIGGSFTGNCGLFSVNGTSCNFIGVSYETDGTVNTVSFIYTTQFVAGGSFYGRAAVFTATSTGIVFDRYAQKNGATITGTIYSSAVLSGSSLLILGGALASTTSICASVFYITQSGALNYLYEIQSGGSALDGAVRGIAFYPNGERVVLCGDFTGRALVCSVNQQTISAVSFLTRGASGNITETQYGLAINAAGDFLVLSSGEFYHIADDLSCVYVTNLFSTISQVSNANARQLVFFDDSELMVGGIGSGVNKVQISDSGIVNGTLFRIQPNMITVSRDYEYIKLQVGSSTLTQCAIQNASNGAANNIAIVLTPNTLSVYSFRDGTYLGVSSIWLSPGYTQPSVTSAYLYGEQIANYFAIIAGDGSDFMSNLQDPNFEFSWSSSTYTLYLNATFNNGLEGGTGSSEGTGFRIYRSAGISGEYKQIATVGADVTQLKDYGIKSGEEYTYYLYAYDSSGGFMGVRQTEPLKRRFKRVSLVVAEYADTDNVYHVIKEYHFALNVENMTVSNNNSPQFSQNFTPYPTRFWSSANYASGTLQSLIGAIDTRTMQYVDTTQLMDELNALSTNQNVLFLKDMKGHLRLVHTGGAIQQTPNQKSVPMQVTISLPWTEIGDASDVSLIALPGDDGWNYDDAVLDVRLDVDMGSGMLNAYYPLLYRGTRFSMDSSGNLNASTPNGITPAKFTLSETASEPDDGELNAELQNE